MCSYKCNASFEMIKEFYEDDLDYGSIWKACSSGVKNQHFLQK